ncbi:MAG: MerC domain-containing protein [bacterium]
MTPPKNTTTNSLDRVAVFLSGLCLLHCLAIPFAVLLGPLMSSWLNHSETHVHWLLLLLAIPVSALALWRGFQRHSSALTLTMGASGLLLMFIAVTHWFGEHLEVALTVIGVTLLMFAHIRNMRSGHQHA